MSKDKEEILKEVKKILIEKEFIDKTEVSQYKYMLKLAIDLTWKKAIQKCQTLIDNINKSAHALDGMCQSDDKTRAIWICYPELKKELTKLEEK